MKLGFLIVLGLLAGCGAPPEVDVEESALTASCNNKSDSSCVGASVGAVCESTGHCRPDGEVHGACDCIVTSPPPPSGCCADGSSPGQVCHLNGFTGTCHVVILGQIAGCTCS
jgi:hypothetical protein